MDNGFDDVVKKTKISLCSLAEVQLRFLCPNDLEEVKGLCEEWFPIEYPSYWYEEITSINRYVWFDFITDCTQFVNREKKCKYYNKNCLTLFSCLKVCLFLYLTVFVVCFSVLIFLLTSPF